MERNRIKEVKEIFLRVRKKFEYNEVKIDIVKFKFRRSVRVLNTGLIPVKSV